MGAKRVLVAAPLTWVQDWVQLERMRMALNLLPIRIWLLHRIVFREFHSLFVP